jgi:sulfatase maturation enzyme AslB (radical SAM superfamily)
MAYGIREAKRSTHMIGVDIVETQGACKWSKMCGSYNVVLGNGLCVSCWDDFGTKSIVNKELREKARRKKSLER